MATANRTPSLSAPVGAYKCCVAYIVAGKERFSPWFYEPARAQLALEILATRFGRAVLVRD